MSRSETPSRCPQCGAGLRPGDETCPACGGVEKGIPPTAPEVPGGPRSSPSPRAVQPGAGSPKALATLVAAMTGLLLLLAAIGYGVYRALPLPEDQARGISTLVVLALVLLLFWQKRRLASFIGWLDRKVGAGRDDRAD